MTTIAQRVVPLVAAAAVILTAAGCFPSRQAVYSDIEASRQLAYKRWQEATGDENLPKLDGKLGIVDAVKVALGYNKSLRQVEQAKEIARGQVMQAYSQGLPTIEFDANYTRLDQVETINFGTGSVSLGFVDNYNASFTITQPLFKGAVLPAVRGANLFRYMSDESVRQAVQDVVLSVANDYYSVLLADELYKVQQAALEFAEANLQNVLAREKQGVAIRYDELRAELEVSSVKSDLIHQRNQRSRALTALLRDMGASQKSNIELTDALTYQPLAPALERAVQVAFSNRPDIISDELNVRLQREVLLGLWTNYLPKVEGWATGGWAKPDPHDPTRNNWDDQWQAGLRLTWILFDGLNREGQIIQQKAVARQSVITLSDAEQALLQQVKNAILDLADADELVQSQQLNLQQANEALRLVQVGAREGVNTELQMLDARSALTNARGLYYQALYSHVTARLALQRALGMMGPGPGKGDIPKEGPPLGEIKEFAPPAPEGTQPPAAAQPANGAQPAAATQPGEAQPPAPAPRASEQKP